MNKSDLFKEVDRYKQRNRDLEAQLRDAEEKNTTILEHNKELGTLHDELSRKADEAVSRSKNELEFFNRALSLKDATISSLKKLLETLKSAMEYPHREANKLRLAREDLLEKLRRANASLTVNNAALEKMRVRVSALEAALEAKVAAHEKAAAKAATNLEEVSALLRLREKEILTIIDIMRARFPVFDARVRELDAEGVYDLPETTAEQAPPQAKKAKKRRLESS
jgi:chromosome segregation ATPase